MKANAIDVAAFLRDDTDRAVICQAAEIRRKALDACYLIPGYYDLPLREQNAIYDEMRRIIESNEMKRSV